LSIQMMSAFSTSIDREPALSASLSQSRRIVVAATKLFLGTFASRMLGFVRMLLMARYFGARGAMDMFNIAYMIPNLFRRVLGEEAVESSFLPTFKSLSTRGRVREAWRTAGAVLNWLLVLLVVAAGLCALLAPQLVSWLLAPGFDAEMAAETATLGRVMCPFMLIIGLAAFVGSLLLAHGQVWAYGAAPTLFNVGWIASIVFTYRDLGLTSMALGVFLGGCLQLAAASLALLFGPSRTDDRRQFRLTWRVDEHTRQVFCLAGPVCGAALVARLASVVDRAVASFLPEGSVAALGYAMPLVLLPFALFGLSVGRAALVPLSESAAAGDSDGFNKSLSATVRLGLALLIPISVGTMMLARPLVAVLQSGDFGAAETTMGARALLWYAPGLLGMGLVSILSRALHALKDTASPLRAAVVAFVINAALSAALALTPLAHGGIALATSIAMTLQAGLLFMFLKRKHGAMARELGQWAPVARVCLASAAMIGVLAVTIPFATSAVTGAGLFSRLARLLLPAGSGAVAYGLALAILFRISHRDTTR
jgi:putative peptidoglycan lipid II flippase